MPITERPSPLSYPNAEMQLCPHLLLLRWFINVRSEKYCIYVMMTQLLKADFCVRQHFKILLGCIFNRSLIAFPHARKYVMCIIGFPTGINILQMHFWSIQKISVEAKTHFFPLFVFLLQSLRYLFEKLKICTENT